MSNQGFPVVVVLAASLAVASATVAQEMKMSRAAGAVLVLPDGRMAVIAAGPQGAVVRGLTDAGEREGEPLDLQVGDLIARFQEVESPTVEQIASTYEALEVGAAMTLVIRRDGAERTLTFNRPALPPGTRTVVARPGDPGAGAWVSGGGTNGGAGMVIAGIHVKENDQGMPEVTHRTSHPAAMAIDLRSGDVITTIQARPIAALAGLELPYGRIAAGEEVVLTVTRDGASVTVRFAKPTEP